MLYRRICRFFRSCGLFACAGGSHGDAQVVEKIEPCNIKKTAQRIPKVDLETNEELETAARRIAHDFEFSDKDVWQAIQGFINQLSKYGHSSCKPGLLFIH